ncbi:putative nucleic acid-binding Zn-ribbon protein [Nocardioides zeae]|uniref:Nucleic acid-binding Zn-ribbon protein n=2 Tax=Nocardioides zeae TaxID=1457234 RepID=A0ACC6IH00_9ACTN|nr:C4-type zinc ribbon domain-containing protein [Nocardioides zeae]MDQ1103509.1 putative nucleic acid-binding Zn-ribbon protein [Nocardioides zeae]MDR6172772.1 putative nucleic acid-binding Zn-ribbon protein [Nocardioides zeae]MDR6209782.1 putative nucleic acid-binding Zn-ribbon protein [Nocardioides zeae]
MIKADPFAQRKLLDVQALDSRLDQLKHRRTHLPQLARLEELAASRRGVDDQARDARIAVDDLSLEQRKADADVEQVKARRARDQQRMDAGLVTNPKDLERMQNELVSLERRIGSLEDTELEIMERLEEAQGRLTAAEARLAEIDAETQALSAERDAAWAELDAELEAAAAERSPLVEDLPADLLALYDKIRQKQGGIGAAELRRRECGGCRLTLDNAELAVIKAASVDTVVRCEECSRILVRTGESGL